jgi:hypothetical protein
MDGATTTSARHHPLDPNSPYESYHRIHKRFVGPATADKLVNFYESISQTQKPREMFVAGWAAAEAALVGSQYTSAERSKLAIAAKDCWEYSLQLETERASASAWERDTVPDATEQYRIASTIALAPIIEAISRGVLSKQTLRACQEQLIDVADLNFNDMMTAVSTGSEGRASSHMGVAFEQIATLGVNRLLSARIVSLFSLARSGTGFYYPKQTHDVMILNLDRGNITRVTPTEVKSKLKVKFSNRYEAALVGGKAMLGEDRRAIGDILGMFRRELEGGASDSEHEYLDTISASIIHSVRHHHRAEKFGRHCLEITRCHLPDRKLSTAS